MCFLLMVIFEIVLVADAVLVYPLLTLNNTPIFKIRMLLCFEKSNLEIILCLFHLFVSWNSYLFYAFFWFVSRYYPYVNLKSILPIRQGKVEDFLWGYKILTLLP